MKFERTEWWVEYNWNEDGVAINIRAFQDKDEAEKFADEVGGEAVETKMYRC